MSQEYKAEHIIMKNILFLVQSSKKTLLSQRNLLNKWFQDSIKSYILESIASPLISNNLNLDSSAELKAFIHKQVDKYKPKYMGIIDQYFFYIKKCNQSQQFIQKLQKILMNPNEITKDTIQTYNSQKKVRKQFVCFLILKYFQILGLKEMSSFYDLWNFCFPEEIQIKKKLSRFDIKIEKQTKRRKYAQSTDSLSSLIFQNFSHSLLINSQQDTQIEQKPYIQSTLNDFDSFNTEIYEKQKEPINNRIFEEESGEQKYDDIKLQSDSFYKNQQQEEQNTNTNYFQNRYFENDENQYESFYQQQQQQEYQEQYNQQNFQQTVYDDNYQSFFLDQEKENSKQKNSTQYIFN